MKMEIEKCELTGGELRVLTRFTASFDEMKRECAGAKDYDLSTVRHVIREAVAKAIAEEYLASHKMELTNAISLKEVAEAIQLRIVQEYSLSR